MHYRDWLLEEKETADRHQMRLDERIAASVLELKAYRSGKKPLGDISNLAPKRNNKKKKQPTGLKVSVVAEEDEQIGEEWFLHDHQKCIDCLSVSPPDIEEQYFLNWPPSSSHVEPEKIADPEPEEMRYCDWFLEEKDHRMTLDQRMVMELVAEIADRRRMKLEAKMADLEDQYPLKDEEPNCQHQNMTSDVIFYNPCLSVKGGMQTVVELSGSHSGFELATF
ncbi:hypothetical protein EZV62_027529 [Acer yangbiense]|uniref:Uncharacterized protein n=1 Tax=Acer yangbiense TaxID=1000413 RepID=A0A5C7GUL8_9ROSI|nr:hypothetical protein EZV62_027529 [Acer yangbiense]